MYNLNPTRQFRKDFERLDAQVQTRVLTMLEKMRMTPLAGAKKLKNVGAGIWRLRIGDYRLRFDLLGKQIYLYRIRHRKEVYKS